MDQKYFVNIAADCIKKGSFSVEIIELIHLIGLPDMLQPDFIFYQDSQCTKKVFSIEIN